MPGVKIPPGIFEKRAAELTRGLLGKVPEKVSEFAKKTFPELLKASTEKVPEVPLESKLEGILDQRLIRALAHQRAFEAKPGFTHTPALSKMDRDKILAALLRQEERMPGSGVNAGDLTKFPYSSQMRFIDPRSGLGDEVGGTNWLANSVGEWAESGSVPLRTSDYIKSPLKQSPTRWDPAPRGGWRTTDFTDRVKRRLDWLADNGFAERVREGRKFYYKSTEKGQSALRLAPGIIYFGQDQTEE